MNSRTILIMAVATVGLGAAAMWSSRDKHSAGFEEGGYLFPDLVERVNDIAEVEIRNKDEAYTLQRDGETWGMVERSGFEVPIDKVREITNQIAFFEILEQKTSTPSLYPDLSVEDIDTPDASSTHIALKSASGELLADVLIGKPATNNDPLAQGSLYVRKVGDPRSYEVKGRLNVNGTAVSMLESEILQIERDRVRRRFVINSDHVERVSQTVEQIL